MLSIEDKLNEIERKWFSNHVATIKDYDDHMVIYWKEKGTFMYSIKYILHGSNIFISGDLGDAVYQLTCKATLENISDMNLHYFNTKLTALDHDKEGFNQDKAIMEMDNYMKEYKIDKVKNEEIINELKSAINESYSIETYRQQLTALYYMHCDNTGLLENAWMYGSEIRMSSMAFWKGMQMVIEQQKEIVK